MDEMTWLREKAVAGIRLHPKIKGDVEDAWSLMIDEIEDGSSDELEQDRFLDELRYLIEFRSKTNG